MDVAVKIARVVLLKTVPIEAVNQMDHLTLGSTRIEGRDPDRDWYGGRWHAPPFSKRRTGWTLYGHHTHIAHPAGVDIRARAGCRELRRLAHFALLRKTARTVQLVQTAELRPETDLGQRRRTSPFAEDFAMSDRGSQLAWAWGRRLIAGSSIPRRSPLVFMSSVPLCFRVRRVVLIASAALAFPAMVGAATIKVCASGCPYSNLQSAINAAQPGDTLLLRAGETFVGNFLLPAKTASSTAFITIRSDAADSALPGPATRLVPSGRSGANTSRTLLPRLLGAGGTATSVPVIRTLPGAHHFRLQFLEVDGTAQLGYETLIAVGTDKADTPPHDIVFDRVYVHGHATKGQKRGIALNGGSTDVLNSYIADIKCANYESQALAGWNGAGPYRIVNNYIEAAGENVMFGVGPARAGLIPSDIVITGNDIAKVTAWRNPILAAPGAPQSRGVLGDRIAERRKALLQDRSGDAVGGRGTRFTAVCRGLGDRDVRPRNRPVLECQCRSRRVSDLPRGTTAGGEAKYITTSGSTASFVYTGAAESTGKPRTSATRRIAKNLLEVKNAQRVTIDGNRFENNWSGDQPGYALVFTPRNVAGKMPWAAVRDITFTNNIVRHTAGAFNILGYDGTQAAGSQITQRISIRNNLSTTSPAICCSTLIWGGGNIVVLLGGAAVSDWMRLRCRWVSGSVIRRLLGYC